MSTALSPATPDVPDVSKTNTGTSSLAVLSSTATIVGNATETFASNARMVWGLWIPNIVYLFASLGIVIAAQKKLRASNVAYFIAYMPSAWGRPGAFRPRYLTAAYPLALALGAITEKKWGTAGNGHLSRSVRAYLVAFVNQWYVY
jgi:hypothetical protein